MICFPHPGFPSKTISQNKPFLTEVAPVIYFTTVIETGSKHKVVLKINLVHVSRDLYFALGHGY